MLGSSIFETPKLSIFGGFWWGKFRGGSSKIKDPGMNPGWVRLEFCLSK